MLQHLTDKTNNPSVICQVIKTWDIIYPSSGRSRHMRYLLVDTEVFIVVSHGSLSNQIIFG